jgi:hypothetical protein
MLVSLSFDLRVHLLTDTRTQKKREVEQIHEDKITVAFKQHRRAQSEAD